MSSPASWNVEQVGNFLSEIGLSNLVPAFQENAVNGKDLLGLSDDDFQSSLKVTPLQVRSGALKYSLIFLQLSHFALLNRSDS